MLKYFLFFILQLLSLSNFTKAQTLISPKPGITINGNQCLIGNTIYSCTPKTCDSLVIPAGDSITFCTDQQIFLNTDTAYWMEWNFTGSSNYPNTIHNGFPTLTPFCYSPVWTTPGSYVLDIYYNGWMSAYPSGDCWSFGPSHWIISLTVLPNSNAIEENSLDLFEIIRVPNSNSFEIKLKTESSKSSVSVYNSMGQTIIDKSFFSSTIIDMAFYPNGIYFFKVDTGERSFSKALLIL